MEVFLFALLKPRKTPVRVVSFALGSTFIIQHFQTRG